MKMNKKLSAQQQAAILKVLKERFEKNMTRHKGLVWSNIAAKLEKNTDKLWSLHEMEKTGGEPDVVAYDAKTKEYLFYDCSKESPSDRRSLCYDQEALESRKAHKPKSSVMDMTSAMGVELLDEDHYRALQKLGSFDTKTSSWIKTPAEIRTLGGAIFADFRYESIFVYHNRAESYYAARGFRALLRV